MRSERNYAHLVADALGATLVDTTASGATTDTILTTRQRLGFTRVPPQIEQINPQLDLDLVTITVGGNDLGYLASIFRAALAGWFSGRAITRPLGRRMRATGPAVVTSTQVDNAAAGLTRVVDAVARRAPDARILLVDYLTIFGPDTRATPTAPFTEAELTNFRRTATQLAAAFASAERDTKAELVRVSALSETHGVDAAEPWVYGFRPAKLSSSFHPNNNGMQAVAAAIVNHLNRD